MSDLDTEHQYTVEATSHTAVMGVEEREDESKAQVEARREDAIAGNPAAIEAFNTSLQLEGVDEPHPEGATREVSSQLHGIICRTKLRSTLRA